MVKPLCPRNKKVQTATLQRSGFASPIIDSGLSITGTAKEKGTATAPADIVPPLFLAPFLNRKGKKQRYERYFTLFSSAPLFERSGQPAGLTNLLPSKFPPPTFFFCSASFLLPSQPTHRRREREKENPISSQTETDKNRP